MMEVEANVWNDSDTGVYIVLDSIELYLYLIIFQIIEDTKLFDSKRGI